MVGRAQPGIEDQVEVGALGRRLLERADGLAGQQWVERMRSGVHRRSMQYMRMIVICEVASSAGFILYF